MIDHPAYRRRAGNGALFTSGKCPCATGIEYSCELPFGYVWTPMSPLSSDFGSLDCEGEALVPVLCLSCLSYCNMYATVDLVSGRWICPICKSENVGPRDAFRSSSDELGGGAAGPGRLSPILASPTVEYTQRLRPSNGGMNSSYVNHCSYILVLDSNLNKEEAIGVGVAVQSAMESLLSESSTENTYIDLGLVVFDKVVAMYQLGLSGTASADVCSSDQANTEEHLQTRKNQITQRSYLARIKNADSLSCLWRCLSAVFGISKPKTKTPTATAATITSSSNTKENRPLSRLEMLKKRKEARLKNQQKNSAVGKNNHINTNSNARGVRTTNQQQQESPWVAARRKSSSQHPYRCTGEAIQTAIDLATVGPFKASHTSRILLFTNGCPNLGDGSVVASDDDMHYRPKRTDGSIPDVVQPQRLATAVQYFELTAKYASEHSIAMDVFCTGATELGLPAYQALVDPSCGYVLTHDTFTTPHLKHDLDFLINHTYVSRAEKDDHQNLIDGCIVDMRMCPFVSPSHLVGSGELLDNDNFGPLPNERSAFAIGASLSAGQGLPTNDLPSKEIMEVTSTRLKMGRYDPLATFSVMLQVNDEINDEVDDDDEEEEETEEVGMTQGGGREAQQQQQQQKQQQQEQYAFFQCIVRYLDRTGQFLTTRVSTHRLPIANTSSEFLDSIDDDVVPVVLGREAVYRSMFGREITEDTEVVLAPDNEQLEQLAYEAKRDLDATIQRISGSFRLIGLERGLRDFHVTDDDEEDDEEGGGLMRNTTSGSRSASSLDFAFPPELADALRRLFHLRRGPLLSTGPNQSMDDRAMVRSYFLRSTLEDCLCLMAPSLWSTGCISIESLNGNDAPVPLEPVPAETLSLWDNCIIAADHHDNLFVWSGRGTLGREYDRIRQQCKDFLLQRSKNRHPMPKFHMLSEGDSMSRRLVSRLAPSHSDPLEHQVAHFPALASLTEEQLSTLRRKFGRSFYDATLDPSFRSWFWGVASATSASKDEGLSLCE